MMHFAGQDTARANFCFLWDNSRIHFPLGFILRKMNAHAHAISYEYDLLWDELCLDHKSYFAESCIYLDAEL